MAEIAAFKAVVYGRVQGVYYRAFVQNRARQVKLIGYVRNLTGGSVQVYAEGEKAGLEQLLELLKEGPPGARVDEVKVTRVNSENRFKDFLIMR